MGKALGGIKVLDVTHVQSGPSCTQLLAFLGCDVIKVERPGTGDVTRTQLRDLPDVDSLYFAMLNHNKRSIALDLRHEEGCAVMWRLIGVCDVLVENFAPGALDRLGFTWDAIHKANPKLILGSVKGYGPGPFENGKVYENVAQCAGGAASTTGFDDGPPTVTGAQIGDSGTGLHLALGIVAALYQRVHTGMGQRVSCAMQDGVLNLCRVKLRDQQRLAHGPLKEYPQFSEGRSFGSATPRSGNASGGGQPGCVFKCKGAEQDPNQYIYIVVQAAVWPQLCQLIGAVEWISDSNYATPQARLPRLSEIYERIEEWTKTRSKHDAMKELEHVDVPCGPILSMEELAADASLRATGTVVEVNHPKRGSYLTVGNPIKMSDHNVDVVRSPLLGEHTAEILRMDLGFSEAEATRIMASGATGDGGEST